MVHSRFNLIERHVVARLAMKALWPHSRPLRKVRIKASAISMGTSAALDPKCCAATDRQLRETRVHMSQSCYTNKVTHWQRGRQCNM